MDSGEARSFIIEMLKGARCVVTSFKSCEDGECITVDGKSIEAVAARLV